LRFSPYFLVLLVFAVAAPVLRSQPEAAPVPPPVLRNVSAAETDQAERWLRSLSLRERIAQLLVVPFYGYFPEIGSEAELRFRKLVGEVGVGGVIILNRVQEGAVRRAQPYEMAAFLNHLQRQARVPLLVAGDFERGPSMRLDGMTLFPHAMAFGSAGDLELTRRFGEATACEARALGVHWILAPSADVNSEPENPVIHLRSFGETAPEVSRQVTAFIQGVQENPRCPLLATVKHFPGHGDTNVDSHYGLPSIKRPLTVLENEDIPPFRAAIDAGVASVMPGHLSVPALDATGVPATVSRPVVTGYLREKLRFGGLVATDGMDMDGLTKLYPAGEASVRALEAGANVLVIPPDPEASLQAIEQAVREGRLSEQQIEDSARRVLLAKVKLKLHEARVTDLEKIAGTVPSAQSQALALEVARRAITPLRNRRATLPLRGDAANCVVVLNRNPFMPDGRTFVRSFRQQNAKAKSWFVDETWSDAALGQLRRDLRGCATVSVASFISISGFKPGEVPLPKRQAGLVKALERNPARLVILGFTNPYLASHFPKASAAVAPFSSVPISEQATAEALFGAFPMTGKSPVTIRGLVDAMTDSQ
jgi:beta-N-acetylhexosaminidase